MLKCNQKQCSNLIKILIDEKELTLLNFKGLTDALTYKNTELVTSDGNLLLTVDSLITLQYHYRLKQLIFTFCKC